MYIYKTEILQVGMKWFSDKADTNDITVLDQFINEKAADGWELVTTNQKVGGFESLLAYQVKESFS